MSSQPPEFTAFMVLYLILGIGSIIFFFVGVCAILCCCRQRFRGVERKGYVLREADTAPLILPTVSCGQGSGAVTGGIPPQPMPPYPPVHPTASYPPMQPSDYSKYPPDAPPPYGTSPAKY